MTPPVIAVLLLGVLLVMVLGVRELAEGNAQNRAVSVRTALDDVEARAARLDVRADVVLQRTRLGAYLAERLATAGVPMLTSTALALLLGTGLVLTLVIDSLLSRILAPLGFVAAAFLANMYLQRRQGERKELFIAQLPQLARGPPSASRPTTWPNRRAPSCGGCRTPWRSGSRWRTPCGTSNDASPPASSPCWSALS